MCHAPHTYIHTIRDLPKCWPRPLSLVATCILFVSPKDCKPPRTVSGSHKGVQEKVRFLGNAGRVHIQHRPSPGAPGHQLGACAAGPVALTDVQPRWGFVWFLNHRCKEPVPASSGPQFPHHGIGASLFLILNLRYAPGLPGVVGIAEELSCH